MARKTVAPLTGAAKVAVLMVAIGEDIASKVMDHLDEKEIGQLGNHMSFMDTVAPEQLEQVIGEFFESLESGEGGMLRGGRDYMKKMLEKSMDPNKVADILNKITSPGAVEELSGGLEAVRTIDPKTLSAFLKGEHPQTIAIILSHLEGTQAAEILKLLPERFQAEVVFRIATLERIGPGVLKDLDHSLAAEFQAAGATEGSALGGIESAAEIVNGLDHNLEVSVLSEIESNNPELAANIRQLMFVFEDLISLDDRGLQTMLKEVGNEDLSLALKTASEGLKEKVFQNMSKRAATMMAEDLSAMGPVKLSDVEKAQQNILRAVKKLEEEGKIVLAAGGEELV